jgi:PEP-CTERM motif
MLSRTRSTIVALLLTWMSSTASIASVVTFDDIDASGGDVSIDGSYAGLTWSNTFAYTEIFGYDGFNNGIVSMANAAYSGGQTGGATVQPIVGSISSGSGEVFDFWSAYLGSGYYDGLLLTFTGMRDGAILFTKNVLVGTGVADLVDFSFVDIDTLLFSAEATATTSDPYDCGTFNCTQFTMDNLSIDVRAEEEEPSGVPEPPTLALLGVALLGAIARKFLA